MRVPDVRFGAVDVRFGAVDIRGVRNGLPGVDRGAWARGSARWGGRPDGQGGRDNAMDGEAVAHGKPPQGVVLGLLESGAWWGRAPARGARARTSRLQIPPESV